MYYTAPQVALAVKKKNLPANAGDGRDVIQSLGWKDPPEEENGNPLQYSCLKNSMAKRRLSGYSPWGSQKGGYD